jgi:redox-sensitive bicupin YhaK (pirin superfamily)
MRTIKGKLRTPAELSNKERIEYFEFEVEDNTTDEQIKDILEEYWRDWIYVIDGDFEIKSDEKIE